MERYIVFGGQRPELESKYNDTSFSVLITDCKFASNIGAFNNIEEVNSFIVNLPWYRVFDMEKLEYILQKDFTKSA